MTQLKRENDGGTQEEHETAIRLMALMCGITAEEVDEHLESTRQKFREAMEAVGLPCPTDKTKIDKILVILLGPL